MKPIWFKWLTVLTWAGLAARLVAVQVIEHDYYRALARENRIKLEILPAARGRILDRNGLVLAFDSKLGRNYPLAEAGAAAIGYVGEGNREIIGKDGLELEYDSYLKGKPGGILQESGAEGEVVREISRSEPVAGRDLTVTLDGRLEQKAYQLFNGRQGALVASVPGTGEILALVSSPSFDPSQVERFLTDPRLPLFNRAIAGVYPPGSTFKLITATAALEEGKIGPETLIEDTGIVTIGDYRYANWYFTRYGRTDGRINVVGALQRSNDIFFYRLGEQLGIKALADWGDWFGVGVKTDIDLPGEAAGLMPGPEWKEAVKKENWYLGDTLISAIGQGDILMTPLQVNQVTAAFAANGRWCRPHLVSGQNEDYCRRLDLSRETVRLITDGMAAVAREGGTAYPFFDFSVNGRQIRVAAKTGTAEFGIPIDKSYRTHAWFTVFAPAENPEIAVTVLLEAGGEGSADAAPLAKDFLSEYFFLYQ